jgi:RimJ/RimL family protein N-acetyltransferase
MSSFTKLMPFTEEHIEDTFLWVQDQELRFDFLMRQIPTRKTHYEYFKKVLADSSQKVFAILYDDRYVGNCGLKHIIQNADAEFWIYIGDKKARRIGVATEAVRQLMRYCFSVMSLKKIYIHVAKTNKAAIRLYNKLGFIEVELGESSEWLNRDVSIIRMEVRK